MMTWLVAGNPRQAARRTARQGLTGPAVAGVPPAGLIATTAVTVHRPLPIYRRFRVESRSFAPRSNAPEAKSEDERTGLTAGSGWIACPPYALGRRHDFRAWPGRRQGGPGRRTSGRGRAGRAACPGAPSAPRVARLGPRSNCGGHDRLRLELIVECPLIADLAGNKVLRPEIQREILVPWRRNPLRRHQRLVAVLHQPDLPRAVIGEAGRDGRGPDLVVVHVEQRPGGFVRTVNRRSTQPAATRQAIARGNRPQNRDRRWSPAFRRLLGSLHAQSATQ